MKMYAPFIIGAGLLLTMLGMAHLCVEIGDETRKETLASLKGSEVQTFDLIKRLTPLAKGESWYEGVVVTFNSEGNVKVELTLKNMNKLKAEGRTLREAVINLSTPTDAVRQAMEGWGK